MVNVDAQKLSQVIVNLLSNASKYSDPGTEICVNTIVLGDNVQVSVSDKGIGIQQNELTQIFSQFYRISSAAANTRGMGLGLYIAKEIMEAHLGKIWAESVFGKGSTFHILFPIERNKAMN